MTPKKFKQTEIGEIEETILKMRCVKRRLKYPSKDFDVLVIKDSPARAKLKKIIVDENFFDKFNEEEQEAILYHEEYHQTFKAFIRKLRYWNLKKARWQEEFYADNYSKEKVGKKSVLSFLIKAKKLYEQGKIAYDEKTHPPIGERIKQVKNSKNAKPKI